MFVRIITTFFSLSLENTVASPGFEVIPQENNLVGRVTCKMLRWSTSNRHSRSGKLARSE